MHDLGVNLPPGQQQVARDKWPVVGERAPLPQVDGAPWTLEVAGLVTRAQRWTLAELQAWPQAERAVDLHCVTRWSRPGVLFRGVPLLDLLALAEPLPEARYVSFVAHTARGHSTSLAFDDLAEIGALVALEAEGAPLAIEHGGPARLVAPSRYFYKSLKWLTRIELLARDRLGYWESQAGYHNRGNPWAEERYMAPTVSRQVMQTVLAARDFRDRDLRGLAAAGHALDGLRAEGALLRDADFRGASLRGARFERANLTNAHFQDADLQATSFQGADVEGADFCGADLRGVDFRGAALLAASFLPDANAAPEELDPARLDMSTQFDRESLELLTPLQQAFVARSLGW